MNITIYPGTFDPITLGHVDLIDRAAKIFDKVVVAVAVNENKNPLFSLAERVNLVEQAIGDRKNIIVEGFSSLLTDFAKKHNASSILRGLRAVSDFDYEFQLASMNRRLAPDIETIFLMPAERYSYISSKLVREIASLGGEVKDFVPDFVSAAFKKKIP